MPDWSKKRIQALDAPFSPDRGQSLRTQRAITRLVAFDRSPGWASHIPAGQPESVVAGIRASVGKTGKLLKALLTLAWPDRGITVTEIVDLPTAVEDAANLLAPLMCCQQGSGLLSPDVGVSF
jgi:hypothetical protein